MIGSLLLLSMIVVDASHTTGKMAICRFNNAATRAAADSDNDVYGTVVLSQASPSDPLLVVGQLRGLKANQSHGFHIHTGKTLMASGSSTCGASATLGHYNPFKFYHGGPANASRHVGDLGNIVANENGTANVAYVDNRVGPLATGPMLFGSKFTNNVIGRSMVVHALADNFQAGPGGFGDLSNLNYTGGAGGRVGCCIIEDLVPPSQININSDGNTTKMASCDFSNDATRNSADSSNNVFGKVTLVQDSPSEPLIVIGSLAGLSASMDHGFHIHTGTSIVDNTGTATCAASVTAGHYNPFMYFHGGPGDATRHVGDLGNVQADSVGYARVTYVEDRTGPLRGGPALYGDLSGSNVIGRAMVAHAGTDNLQSGPGGDDDFSNIAYTGGAGGRVGCCIISELISDATSAPTATINPTTAPTAIISTTTPTAAPTFIRASTDDDDNNVCFSGDQTVRLSSGKVKYIKDVAVGDSLQIVDRHGSVMNANVIFLPHKQNSVDAAFVYLKTASGFELKVSRKHLMLASTSKTAKFELMYAEDVKVGMQLATVQEGESKVKYDEVTEARIVTSRGLYTIVTDHSDGFLIVSGFAASSFAINHWAANAYYHVHRVLAYLAPSLLETDLFNSMNLLVGDIASSF